MPTFNGARLRELRIAAGLSQQDVATRVQVTKSRVSQWETDLEAGLDSLKRLEELAQVFGVGVEELMVPPRFTPPGRVTRRSRDEGATVVALPVRVPPELLGRANAATGAPSRPPSATAPNPLAGLSALQQAAVDMFCKACRAGVVSDQQALAWLNTWHAQLNGSA